jgi:hypothetical protein
LLRKFVRGVIRPTALANIKDVAPFDVMRQPPRRPDY